MSVETLQKISLVRILKTEKRLHELLWANEGNRKKESGGSNFFLAIREKIM